MSRVHAREAMNALRVLGLVMIVIFLPVNIPLWRTYLDLGLGGLEIPFYLGLFVLGCVIFVTSSRAEMKDGLSSVNQSEE